MTSTARRQAMMVAKQLYYEQLGFWRNPFGALFTVGFSLVFLVLLGATDGTQHVPHTGVEYIQYYTPAFAAYGIMSACFNTLAISLVNRRETGLLKRLRLSPLPTWVMIGGLLSSALVVSVVQVLILLVVGRFGFQVHLPLDWGPLFVTVAVGVVCFTALGIAASTVVPNQDAAGPIVSVVFFVMMFLSGLYFRLTAGSALADFSKYFPFARLIDAMFAPFERGASPWAWGDLAVIAIWGVAGVVVAVRRFRFEPRRA